MIKKYTEGKLEKTLGNAELEIVLKAVSHGDLKMVRMCLLCVYAVGALVCTHIH